MRGLLADVNLQGHLPYLRRLMEQIGVLEVLTEMDISLAMFPDVGLERDIRDRNLWSFCQKNDWVLFTDNRNHESPDSLNATLEDSWHAGLLPVFTLANKSRFENSISYAKRVAEDVAEQLVVAFVDRIREQARIYVPV